MRAIQLTAYGDPLDVLQVVDLPDPDAPGPGQVLIRMELAPLNKHDLLFVGGFFGGPPAPTVAGNEGFGRVVAVGPDVINVKVGDQVLAPVFSLTWREKIVVAAEGLFALPDGDAQQLAQAGSNPATAALILSSFVDLEPGDWVVQNGGNSGVGRSLVAIAKNRGFRTISLVRRAELIDELKAAGADVVLLDGPSVAADVAAVTGGASIKLAVDSIGGTATASLVQVLGDRGFLVTYAAASGHPLEVHSLLLIGKHLTVRGFFLGDYDFLTRIVPAQTEAAPLISSGALNVSVAAVYPIAQIRQAVEHVLAGGKILLDFTAEV